MYIINPFFLFEIWNYKCIKSKIRKFSVRGEKLTLLNLMYECIYFLDKIYDFQVFNICFPLFSKVQRSQTGVREKSFKRETFKVYMYISWFNKNIYTYICISWIQISCLKCETVLKVKFANFCEGWKPDPFELFSKK